MATRVLVVDDEPAICELIQEALHSVEIESLALSHTGLALTHLAKEKFDAVFLDVHMPSPDGIELTRRIRSGGLNVSTPVIVVTGEDERALLARAFEAGANFFLHKPVDRHDILRLIRVAHGSIENERRRFHRVKVQCKVSIECGSARLTGSTLDLSIGGIFVQSSSVFPVGSAARVEINLPSRNAVSLSARVLRITDGDCMGLQFESLSVQQTKTLQDFLLPLIAKGHNE